MRRFLPTPACLSGHQRGWGLTCSPGTQEDLFEVNILDSLAVLRSALEAAEDAVIRFLKVA